MKWDDSAKQLDRIQLFQIKGISTNLLIEFSCQNGVDVCATLQKAISSYDWTPLAVTLLLGAAGTRTGKDSALSVLPVFLIVDIASLLRYSVFNFL